MDRSDLHQLLKTLTDNVYFQPPPKTEILYPCIIYSRDAADTQFADNVVYNFTDRYQVTVIDRDPDGPIRKKVAYLPQCLFTRFFVRDGLNHDVFSLYY